MTLYNGEDYIEIIIEDNNTSDGDSMCLCYRYDGDWNRYNFPEFHLLSTLIEDGYEEVKEHCYDY